MENLVVPVEGVRFKVMVEYSNRTNFVSLAPPERGEDRGEGLSPPTKRRFVHSITIQLAKSPTSLNHPRINEPHLNSIAISLRLHP
jgi:hypothetical protein